MGQQLLFKRKHRVVPIHGHVYRKLELEVSRTMDIESKVYLLSMLGRKKKVQDCDYVLGSSTNIQRRMNGFVKADIRRQVSVCFVGFYLPLNPCAASITITMQIMLVILADTFSNALMNTSTQLLENTCVTLTIKRTKTSLNNSLY